jgi:hypothetical protein
MTIQDAAIEWLATPKLLGMQQIGATPVDFNKPRQNRKRGDDLSAVEYIQREDPGIQKKKVKEYLDNL